MKPAIHYEFIAKIIKKKKEDGEFEFIETRKEFFDDEPINAREAAFKFYQNYIEVLLEAKGLKYESDKQARMALKSFYDPETKKTIEIDSEEIYISDSIGNGVGVFLVTDEYLEGVKDPSEYDIDLSKYYIIHGIGNLHEGNFDEDSIVYHLTVEIQYYECLNYNQKNYKSKMLFCDGNEWVEGYRDDEPQEITYLKTPFDWTGYDEPYWWGDEGKDDSLNDNETSTKEIPYERIIAGGERSMVEFKPSLVYNFKSKQAAIGVKNIIAKSICSFLNSKGGFLFIGVNDDGKIQGLEYDFSLAKDKNAADFFRLEFDNMIMHFLPLFTKTLISGEFISLDNKLLWVVKVHPSISRPVFMKGQYEKEFWVRWEASSRQYRDIEDITEYCLEHWGNKSK